MINTSQEKKIGWNQSDLERLKRIVDTLKIAHLFIYICKVSGGLDQGLQMEHRQASLLMQEENIEQPVIYVHVWEAERGERETERETKRICASIS